MNKIIRFFNQNRELFFRVIIIIAAFFIGLQFLNYIAKKQSEEKLNFLSNNTAKSTYNRDYAISSGEMKDENIYYLENNLIERFFQYCNKKEFESAYNLLTQKCKDLMYPDLETFVKEYGEKLFNETKNYNIQAWNSNIYKVKIMEDLIANGKTSDTDFNEYYFSVINNKLNINNYIDTIKIQKTAEKANVILNIKKIDCYIDYSIVEINVINNRETSIMLNARDYAENIYLEDSQNLKYAAFLHELTDDEFIISKGQNKDISIKFDIPYTKIGDIQSFNIDNMICNYEQYQEVGDSRIIQFNIDI